ncbi:LysR family transcriptional regulator [uncultured Pseudoteredinibacter sp.]|uniref:LysR family transcriptional regulator n=1 Tax=uncultured Pseudoteredinibacter sp. TaxID=1641701 RepID=UPI002607E152|nr:LysR family transcriptional regulator [uncultured Pseudoteredinibacter sp.]
MRLSQVDLNLFVVFDAIYTEKNLTRAAEVLCITQPAVSNALNRLRKTFDDQLFVRTPDGMMPTPVAENIVGRVREALQLLNMSVQEGDKFSPETSEKVIACSMNDLGETLILPPIMSHLQRLAPKMTLTSYYVPREDMAKELAAGSLDFAIDVPLVVDNNLCHAPLSGEDYVCVVRPDHPAVRNELSLKQYLELGHINVSSRRKGQSIVDHALNGMGMSRNIKVRVQHYMVGAKIVANTDLVWTLPIRLARQLDFKILPLPFDVPALNWHLFWHKSADDDHANKWLRNLFLHGIQDGIALIDEVE